MLRYIPEKLYLINCQQQQQSATGGVSESVIEVCIITFFKGEWRSEGYGRQPQRGQELVSLLYLYKIRGDYYILAKLKVLNFWW